MPCESTTRSGRSVFFSAAVMSSTSITGRPCSSNCTSGGVPRRNSTPARRASEVPVLVADAGGAQLEVADRHLHLGKEALEPRGVLEGDHAAQARAVGQAAAVARAGALDHHHFAGRHAAHRRHGGPVVHHLGELGLRDDVVVAVAEVADQRRRRGSQPTAVSTAPAFTVVRSRRLAEIDRLAPGTPWRRRRRRCRCRGRRCAPRGRRRTRRRSPCWRRRSTARGRPSRRCCS